MSDKADEAQVVVKEEIVLNKFDGPPEDGVILETIYLTNGKITRHDVYEDGILINRVGGI